MSHFLQPLLEYLIRTYHLQHVEEMCFMKDVRQTLLADYVA
jgi:hypothetical protein